MILAQVGTFHFGVAAASQVLCTSTALNKRFHNIEFFTRMPSSDRHLLIGYTMGGCLSSCHFAAFKKKFFFYSHRKSRIPGGKPGILLCKINTDIIRGIKMLSNL